MSNFNVDTWVPPNHKENWIVFPYAKIIGLKKLLCWEHKHESNSDWNNFYRIIQFNEQIMDTKKPLKNKNPRSWANCFHHLKEK